MGLNGSPLDFPAGTAIAPMSGAYILSTPLAKFGKTAVVLEGSNKQARQYLSADDVHLGQRHILSVYASIFEGVSPGLLNMAWGAVRCAITVGSATSTSITASETPSFVANEHAGSSALIIDGDGRWQARQIESNDLDTLYFSSTNPLSTLPEEGDTVHIVPWTPLSPVRLDEDLGAAALTGSVPTDGKWYRYYAPFVIPADALYIHYRFLNADGYGDIMIDGVKLEPVKEVYKGTLSSVSDTGAADTSKVWSDNQIAGLEIFVSGAGSAGLITANGENTFDCLWSVPPTDGDTYALVAQEEDTVPTPFTDLSTAAIAVRNIDAVNIKTGILTVGGPTGVLSQIRSLDALGNRILTIGDNVTDDGGRGIALEQGVGVFFKGGAMVMREDGDHGDYGKRVRASHLGLEVYTDKEVRKAALLAEGLVEVILGQSPLKARVMLSDTVGIAAFDDDDKPFFVCNPVTKTVWCGTPGQPNYLTYDQANGVQISGQCLIHGTLTLDEIDDGEEYGKVKKTILKGGLVQVGQGTVNQDLSGFAMTETEIVGQIKGITQVRMGLDGTIQDASGNVRLDLQGLFASEADFIFGTGTWGEDFSGFRIYKDENGVYLLEGRLDDTRQVWIANDGRLYAGEGAVSLSDDGIRIESGQADVNKLDWTTDGIVSARIFSYRMSSPSSSYLSLSSNVSLQSDGSLIGLYSYAKSGDYCGLLLKSDNDSPPNSFAILRSLSGGDFWVAGVTESGHANFSFNLIDEFGSGIGVISIRDCYAAPTGNPTGGVIVYSDGGLLKQRTSGGVITKLGKHTHASDLEGGSVLEKLNVGADTELTINAAGAITVTKTYHNVDTYENASDDDLIDIYGGSEGDILVLRANDSGRTVTVKNDAGTNPTNISLAGSDFPLDHFRDTIVLFHNGVLWVELSRSDNAT